MKGCWDYVFGVDCWGMKQRCVQLQLSQRVKIYPIEIGYELGFEGKESN